MCVAEPQGISWETPVEGTVKEESLIETDLGEQPQRQEEHQVHLKLTIEDFVLHKMLGKGSFGKVRIRGLDAAAQVCMLLVMTLNSMWFEGPLDKTKKISSLHGLVRLGTHRELVGKISMLSPYMQLLLGKLRGRQKH